MTDSGISLCKWQAVTLASMNGALNAMGLKVTANGPDPNVWMVSDGKSLLRRFTNGMVCAMYHWCIYGSSSILKCICPDSNKQMYCTSCS